MAETSLLHDTPNSKSGPKPTEFDSAKLDGMLCHAYGPLEAFSTILRQLGDEGANPDGRDVNAGAVAVVIDVLQSHAYNTMLSEFSRQYEGQAKRAA